MKDPQLIEMNAYLKSLEASAARYERRPYRERPAGTDLRRGGFALAAIVALVVLLPWFAAGS